MNEWAIKNINFKVVKSTDMVHYFSYLLLCIMYFLVFLGGGQFFVILYLSFVLCHYIWLFFFIFL